MRSKKIDSLLNDLVMQYKNIIDENQKNDIFNQIYDHYKAKFSKIAFKLKNEDIIQELSIALLKAIDTYDNTKATKFNTYFWKIAQNYIGIINYYNNASKRMPTLPLIYLDQPVVVDGSNESVQLGEVIEDINVTNENKDIDFYIFLETDIFINLPLVHTIIIKLFLCGYTMTEIANLLNTNASTIQNKIRSIRSNKIVYNKFAEYFERKDLIQQKTNMTPIYSTEWVQKLVQEKISV